MLKKIMIVVIFCFLTFSSIAEARILLSPRIRIDSVEIEEDGSIEVGDTFHVTVNVTKNRFLGFRGELRVYLTCAGLPQKEIGREDIRFKLSKKTNETAIIPCQIGDIDANWYQQIYNIKVVLYSKIFGRLIQKDISTIEGVKLLNMFWEKDKVKILSFSTPDTWSSEPAFGERIANVGDKDYEKGLLSFATKNEYVNVTVGNDAICGFDVKVRIDLIEKPPMIDIPFMDGLEGFGELRKEIGSEVEYVPPGEQKSIGVCCTLKEADANKKILDVQAVLFINIDGLEYEVDKSTVQSIKVNTTLAEDVVFYGLYVWILFIAGIGTVLLITVTIKIILPLVKIKRDEYESRIVKINRKRKK